MLLTSKVTGIKMLRVRTTLTIDPDVEKALAEEQRRTRQSLKEVVNKALRVGLSLAAPAPSHLPPFQVQSQRCGFRPGIDPLRLNQLVDELEAETFVRAHEQTSK